MITFESDPMEHAGSVQTLNSFLRGEIAAVETYRRALGSLTCRGRVEDLRDCLASHERRMERLRRRIVDLGGVPSESSGPWDGFARLCAGECDAGDEDAALAALEEGEDTGLKHYLDDVGKLDRDSRRFVASDILPEQVRTHDSLSDLKLRLAG